MTHALTLGSITKDGIGMEGFIGTCTIHRKVKGLGTCKV